ncbi:MAG TPA: metallophosphoesterase [Longimicrobium sp.]
MSETITPDHPGAPTGAGAPAIDGPLLSGPWARGGPASEKELPFKPRGMVRWLDPAQLCGTAVRAVLSDVFGAYADQREMQAALSREVEPCDYTEQDEIWIDYVADLGDGFHSTYTVAWLLAQDRLRVPGPDGRAHDLPRGRVLVMGGDQVYPTASREEYANRMEGPYEAALPCRPDDDHPDLFALPGNHDWYDGLTSFMRQFCQKRWIGGWETRQTRSYFALRLPHRWWLLGTDLQLQSDIDKPQLDYFMELARTKMKPGDRVILCTPEPAWVHVPHKPKAFDNLAYFEQKVLGDRGVTLAVTLTGDLHHYARYADAAGRRHKITAGGGGAYLFGTDRLPERVTLDAAHVRPDPEKPTPADRVRQREVFTEQKVFPSRRTSMAMRWNAVRSVWKNGYFTTLLAGLYLLYAWVLQGSQLSVEGLPKGMAKSDRLIERLASEPFRGGIRDVLGSLFEAARYSPLVVVLTLLIVGSLVAFCKPDAGRPRALKVLGLVHGVAHVALALGLTWLLAWVGPRLLPVEGSIPARVATWEFALFFIVGMVVLGAALGGVLFGLFLLPWVNIDEAFSAQYLSTYRNFLRLHLDQAGNLTIYPIGVRRPARWKLRPNAPPGTPFFVPRSKDGAPSPELIEDPVAVDRAPDPPERRTISVADMAIVGGSPTGKAGGE